MTCNAFSAQAQISLHRIPEGYPGTLKTAAHIARLIRQGARDFHVRQVAIDILVQRGVKPKDYAGEIKALFEWVQQNIRYTKDTVQVEVLHSARRMLAVQAGDCDDFSILLGAMLEAIGHPVRLVLTGPDSLQPRLFSHVYVEANCRGRWLPLDATMPYAMGWAPRALVRKVFEIDRRTRMVADDSELHGLDAALAAPDWLRALIRSVRGEAVQPKDPRVKSLWDLMRQRQVLSRSPWVKALLQRVWTRGLTARPRPQTTRRLVHRLRGLGVLPPRPAGAQAAPPGVVHTIQPMQPVALRPVGMVRRWAAQPVRPVRTHFGPAPAGRR
ncbi:MAG: transglutaminase-like domain-containing protein [Betaproteobacteria bacterium]